MPWRHGASRSRGAVRLAILDEALEAVARQPGHEAVPFRAVKRVRLVAETVDHMAGQPQGLAEIVPGAAREQPVRGPDRRLGLASSIPFAPRSRVDSGRVSRAASANSKPRPPKRGKAICPIRSSKSSTPSWDCARPSSRPNGATAGRGSPTHSIMRTASTLPLWRHDRGGRQWARGNPAHPLWARHGCRGPAGPDGPSRSWITPSTATA